MKIIIRLTFLFAVVLTTASQYVYARPTTSIDEIANLGAPAFKPVGNPINQASGNKYQVERDFTGAGVFPLIIERTYNSNKAALQTYWGSNWHGYYDRSLVYTYTAATDANPNPIQTVVLYRQGGSAIKFMFPQIVGAWVSQNSVGDSIQWINFDPSTGHVDGWLYTDQQGNVEKYNATGVLLSITNRKGFKQVMAYDSSGRLVSVTDPVGRQLLYSYDGSNRVISITEPSTQKISYTYDGNNNLSKVTYQDSSYKTYVYENPSFIHALTGIVDELGVRFASWTYDTSGRANSSQHAGGVELNNLVYNEDWTTTTTDANNTVKTYTFTYVAGAYKISSISTNCNCGTPPYSEYYNYDTDGQINSITNANGFSSTFENDPNTGLVVSRIDANGNTTSTVWDPVLRLPLTITETGRTTTFTYDAQGNILTKSISNGTTSRVWTYSYSGGLLTQIDGPRTDVSDITTIAYDSNLNVASITNALGHQTKFTSYDANGRPLTIVDPNGVTTTLTYSPRGWLTSKSTAGETTAYTYNATGQITQITLPDTTQTSYTYDGAHRLIKIADSLGNSINYTLDAMGNRINEQVKDPSGTLTQQTTRVYDALNHLQQMTTAQNTTTYQSDAVGNITQVTDPLGGITQYSYDPLNNLNVIVDANYPNNGSTQFNFDGLNHLISVIDPNYFTTNYTIDGLDNLTQIASPDTGTTTKTYDEAGNVKTSTDARGKVTTYTYDALNRVTNIAYAFGTATQFQYDGGSTGAPYSKGRLTKLIDESGQTSFTYDALGRVLTKAQTVGSKTFTVTYTYGTTGNTLGKLVSLTYPSGNRTNYTYDGAGRIASVSLNPTNATGTGTNTGTNISIMKTIGYVPFGLPTSWTWGNNAGYTRTIDTAGRITSYPLGNSVANGLIRTLNYDAGDHIVGFTHSGPGTGTSAPANFNQSFQYDALGRVVYFSNYSTSQTYGYDSNGNRVQLSIGANSYDYAIDSSSNKLTSTSGPTPAQNNVYDADGNLTFDGTITFSYSSRGRMSGSLNGGITVNYLYNGFGERVQKLGPTSLIPTGANYYIYDGAGRLLGEYDANGKVIEETAYLDDLPVSVLKQTVSGGYTTTNIYYIYADHTNTPRLITNSSANQIVWRWDGADPFGVGAPDENPAGLGIFTYNLRFAGQLFDKETNNHYNHYRDYNPQIGRYIQSDPIGNVIYKDMAVRQLAMTGALYKDLATELYTETPVFNSSYLYVDANTISYTDPNGLAKSPTYRCPGCGGPHGGLRIPDSYLCDWCYGRSQPQPKPVPILPQPTPGKCQ